MNHSTSHHTTRATHALACVSFLAISLLGACDPGLAVPGTHGVEATPSASTPPAQRREAAPGAYFGDEYADAQRNLRSLAGEADAPTF